MEETLSSIFARTNGTPVNFNGQTVVAIIEIKITKSSPDVTEIEVFSKSGSTLKIWNVWKSSSGMNAWVGNAGMLVCETGSLMKLECSDGVGNVDFSDYVVTLEEQQCR